MTRRILLLGATVMLLASALPVVGASEVMLGSRFERLEVESGRIQRTYGFLRPHAEMPVRPPTKDENGVDRADARGTVAVPMVLAFHGRDGGASGLRWLMQARRMLSEHDLYMIYPEALPERWGGWAEEHHDRELQFIEMILAQLEVDRGLVPDRLYVIGFSSGAEIASGFACRNSERVDALALIGRVRVTEACDPTTQLPTLLVKGLRDPIEPMSARFGSGQAFHESLGFFLELNGLEDPPLTVVDRPATRCDRYATHQPEMSPVVSCLIRDAGHTWPGGARHVSRDLGPVSKSFLASRFLVEFLGEAGARTAPRLASARASRLPAAPTPHPLVAPSRRSDELPEHERGLSSTRRFDVRKRR